MDQVIEFIMNNLFLIVVIVSAIFGFFSNQQKEEEKNQRKQPHRSPARPTQRPVPANRTESKGQPLGRMNTEKAEIEEAMDSIGEQQQRQMEELAQNLNTQAQEAVNEVRNVPGELSDILKEAEIKSLEQERTRLKKQVQGQLKGKRLMNGIIMSEVLGPPRAIKPYRSVVEERRRG